MTSSNYLALVGAQDNDSDNCNSFNNNDDRAHDHTPRRPHQIDESNLLYPVDLRYFSRADTI